MAGSVAYARIKADVIAIVSKIPTGRLATHGAIGRHLSVVPRHVAYVLATLNEIERETVPWWRVVADGGAIGRHQRRDDQMQRLKREGCAVAPAGIVQDFRERVVADVTTPGAAMTPIPVTADGKPARSRGMKSHPGSSV
jgi:methylated-DNA-protein-cysteine methyltransferase related protein